MVICALYILNNVCLTKTCHPRLQFKLVTVRRQFPVFSKKVTNINVVIVAQPTRTMNNFCLYPPSCSDFFIL